MREWPGTFALLMAATLAISPHLQAGDIDNEALATLTAQTTRLECFRLSRLRSLPNYGSLRQRYFVEPWKSLEQFLAQLGITESDVEDLVLGWRPGTSTAHLEGLLRGQFTARGIADFAASVSITDVDIGGLPTHCARARAAETCLVVLKDSLGIFGSQESVANMLAARVGRAEAIASEKRLVKLLHEARTQAPMWGIAVDEGVAAWVRAWLPPRGHLQMNWQRAFQYAKALVYNVETGDQIRFELKMECGNDQSAERTRRVFEGFRDLQRQARRNRNRTGRNPLQFVEIRRDGPRVLLRLVTDYPEP